MKDLFGADNAIQIIGTRHGEKLYESLLSREETARAEDRGVTIEFLLMAGPELREVFCRRRVVHFSSEDYTLIIQE